MKKLIALVAIASALTLTGCAKQQALQNPDVKEVICRGYVEFDTLPGRGDYSRLTMYNTKTKLFYSVGSTSLGMNGWLPESAFYKIVCLDGHSI